ncbi:MAG: carboxylesterase family protein, partial [Dehalococcoidia bacterium]
AAPPVGDLRWKPPQPVVPWSDVRKCTEFSAITPQSFGGQFERVVEIKPQNEDCLHLNVTTPAIGSSDKLPVMVWMHGGALFIGNGNDEIYNLPGLALKGVLLVTINMRLGPLGCLAHPLLSLESQEGVSGNYLFLDMIAALKWVQNNISTFGGDPDNVTIFGESGGSTKVVNLMASPLAKGLFHKAIGQSECGLGTPLGEMEERGERLLKILGVNEERDPLIAARALPWEQIIQAGLDLTQELDMPLGPPWSPWDSAVDGWFLPDTPANIFKEGKQNTVPFITGANLGELTGPGLIEMPWVIPAYVGMFTGAYKVGGEAYGYIFDHVPEKWKTESVVSTHAMELPYLFGDWNWQGDMWPLLYTLAQPSGATAPNTQSNDVDKKVSELMMNMWTNFARTGNPSIEGVIDWPAWDEEKDQYLYITENPEVRSGFSKVGQK